MRPQFTASAVIIVLVTSGTSALARDDRYDQPAVHSGYRLDWCPKAGAAGSACGRATADAFCARWGYERAREFAREPAPATMAYGDARICRGKNCWGFAYIVCSVSGDPGAHRDWPPVVDVGQ
jgi:hypothetical protein